MMPEKNDYVWLEVILYTNMIKFINMSDTSRNNQAYVNPAWLATSPTSSAQEAGTSDP